MRNASLWDTDNRIYVTRTLEMIGDSACCPIIVEASNGKEYVIKREALLRAPLLGETRVILANEAISAFIGQEMRVPIVPWTIVEHQGEPWFASAYQRQSEPIADALRHRKPITTWDFSTTVVFDILICNLDRHDRNFLVSTEHRRSKLWAIDHSHCPVNPTVLPATVAQLSEKYDVRSIVAPLIGDTIRDVHVLRGALRRALRVPESAIENAVEAGRLQDWNKNDRRAVRDFILARQASLPTLIKGRDDVFPCLKGVDL